MLLYLPSKIFFYSSFKLQSYLPLYKLIFIYLPLYFLLYKSTFVYLPLNLFLCKLVSVRLLIYLLYITFIKQLLLSLPTIYLSLIFITKFLLSYHIIYFGANYYYTTLPTISFYKYYYKIYLAMYFWSKINAQSTLIFLTSYF